MVARDGGMKAAGGEPHVIDNTEEERYELWVENRLGGSIAYWAESGTITLIHTEVDAAFEGKGLAALLVRGALEDIRARGLRLVPACSFVRSYLRRHPEFLELVEPPRG